MLSLTTVVTAFGWVGAAAGLVAYAMVSQGRWRPDSVAFQLTNVGAALVLMTVAAIHGVWPSAASNIAAIAIGANALFMVGRARLRKAREAAPDQPLAAAPPPETRTVIGSTLHTLTTDSAHHGGVLTSMSSSEKMPAGCGECSASGEYCRAHRPGQGIFPGATMTVGDRIDQPSHAGEPHELLRSS